jgi:peptidoglycan/LPS O-acetylase OafA/YrhL
LWIIELLETLQRDWRSGEVPIAVLGLASRPLPFSARAAATSGVLGATSYALYLVHPAAETVVIYTLLKVGGPQLSALGLMIVLVSSAVAGGMLFAYGVERPLNRFLQARFLPRLAPAASPALSLIVPVAGNE